MTGRAGRLRRLLAASLAAGVFLITSRAGAAQSGVIVTVQDNYLSLIHIYNKYGSIVKEATSRKPLDGSPRVGCELIS